MTANKGGGPPDPGDGRPRVPDWIGGVGIGQLQILSLEATTTEKRLSPFVVGKSLQNTVGEIESATTEAGGLRYVLRVRDAAQVSKLLSLRTLFDGTEIKVQLHPVLNTRRCVISCREIQQEKEEEILKWLAQDGITAVRRITRLEDGQRVNTPTLILTVNGTVVPEHIRVGPLRIKTRVYIPDPMVCYHCFAYGHTKLRCKSGPKCRNCSGSHDLSSECNDDSFCFHCKGKHSPASRQCPKYVAEKEILKIQHTKGVSYQEAAKQLEAGGGSFAAVSKLQQRLQNVQHPASEELKKDQLIIKLTETIALLNKRIEDLEKKKTTKKNRKNKKEMQEESQADEDQDYETGSEMEVDTTAEKAGAPRASEASFQVSGAKPKTVTSFKRQLTSCDLTLPSKKIPETTNFPSAPPQPTPKQTQPRSQTQIKTGQQLPPNKNKH